MKCKVCGSESGKYPLCRACNLKKEKGDIVKCDKCGNWHYTAMPCPIVVSTTNDQYLYSTKRALISNSERGFYEAIKSSVPNGYCVFPQINLASFIVRTDNARFHNELFRNVDFLITDSEYRPKLIVEINDQTHLTPDRKERDEKVQKICEEAGVPIVKLWTTYGVNTEYIKKRIDDVLSNLPVQRVHHFNQNTPTIPQQTQTRPTASTSQSGGCYIATCVYGSYDCPQVWTLRRYRDNVLAVTWYGRFLINVYYATSPTVVKYFGNTHLFKTIWKNKLDRWVLRLQSKGFESTPYQDISWH